MNMNCHACAIDADSTAFASISYVENGSYSIRECQTLRTGIGEYCGPGREKAVNRLASFLKKKGIGALALSIHTPCFFPLDTFCSSTVSDKVFDSHCRAEAAFLLNKPDEFLHDHIPYGFDREGDPVRKHLLFYYPMYLFEALLESLRTFCSVSSATHYLKPVISSIATTCQPFILLEIEQGYATFSAGNNGELEYFSYWQLNHPSDAEYFALRELLLNSKQRQYPVYMTGTLAGNRSFVKRISHATGKTLLPLNLAELHAMVERNTRPAYHSPVETKALSAAFLSLYEKIHSQPFSP